jgi:RHS repeat-associated protein
MWTSGAATSCGRLARTAAEWISAKQREIPRTRPHPAGNLLAALTFRLEATGFHYLRARYYDPVTGQFLTVDPNVATTLSPYGYVEGDPLNSADPSGKCGGLWSTDSCLTDVENALGGFFGGAATDLEATSSAIGSALHTAYQHITVSYGGCDIGCWNVQFQDGYLSYSGGVFGALGRGPGIGWASQVPSSGVSTQIMGGGGYYVGAGFTMGLNPGTGQLDPCDWSVSLFPALGVYGGVQVTTTVPIPGFPH